MKTNKQLLEVAIKQIGNTGGKYRSYVHASGSWCDMFVFWLFDANGCGSLIPWKGQQRTYCPASIKWCDNNLAQIPIYLAMACDIIYFDWDKNGTPNHIGVVESKVNTSEIKTIEGNTNGGKVARKTRAAKYVQGVYRPHFVPTGLKKEKLSIDGSFGYKSIYMLQVALGITADGILGKATVRALQKAAGASPIDGAWGPATSRKVQRMIGAVQDGQFGPASVRKLQEWTNKKVFPAASKPATSKPTSPANTTNAQKIVVQIKKLAWANGTAKSKYAYKTGAPKDACKKAMTKHGYKTKSKWSDCGDYVNTVVRETGIDKDFVVQLAVKANFPAPGPHFSIVHKGKAIPDGVLKAGDIIRYKKKSGQHAMFYLGDGLISDAGLKNRFANIRKNDHRYNKSNVRKSTIQVLRAK